MIGALTCTHLPSQKRRQTLPSRQGNWVTPLVKLRLASTGRFGSKRILSVGPQLTAFLRIMNGPDIGTVCFLGSHQELPLGICRLMVSRRLGTARTSSKHGILLDFFFFSGIRNCLVFTYNVSPFPPWTGHPAHTRRTCNLAS